MLKYMKPFKTDAIPRVLLIGNGINRAFNSSDWDKLIQDMAQNDRKENWDSIKNLPYPLMAVVATGDRIDAALKEQAKTMCIGEVSGNQAELMQEVVKIDADAILTTNYTYEIEQALNDQFHISPGKTSKYRCKTCVDKSKKDLTGLYQYMNITVGDKNFPIWHIHGEAAKYDSMIIGHYYYGKLLCSVEKYAAEAIRRYKIAERQQGEFYPRSWVDYILFGDVYIVGSGMDFSEMDLWWLINCKKRNGKGKIYYYEPNLNFEKKVLMETYGVEHIDLGVKEDYRGYYSRVFQDISNRK